MRISLIKQPVTVICKGSFANKGVQVTLTCGEELSVDSPLDPHGWVPGGRQSGLQMNVLQKKITIVKYVMSIIISLIRIIYYWWHRFICMMRKVEKGSFFIIIRLNLFQDV